jgi:hypothetical protein
MALIYKRANVAGTGGGSATPPFDSPFVVGDWNLNGANYELTVTEATHGKGTKLSVQVFEKVGVDYREIEVDILVTSTGNVTISISSATDLRFEGRIIIVGE